MNTQKLSNLIYTTMNTSNLKQTIKFLDFRAEYLSKFSTSIKIKTTKNNLYIKDNDVVISNIYNHNLALANMLFEHKDIIFNQSLFNMQIEDIDFKNIHAIISEQCKLYTVKQYIHIFIQHFIAIYAINNELNNSTIEQLINDCIAQLETYVCVYNIFNQVSAN